MAPTTNLAEKRRLLQLETLYDLALALNAPRSEEELVEELLYRVCAVLDPAAAVAVTRDAWGGPRAVATVGWPERPPEGGALLASPLWQELLREGRLLGRRDGTFADRDYGEVVAAPFVSRDVYLGYLAVLDKEARGGASPEFSSDDRRFLDSVASLAAASFAGVRRRERLEAQRERLAEENRTLKGRFSEEVAGQKIIAQAPAMRRALDVVERVAPRGVSVLVRGESGTGKELVAKLLHHLSGRSGALIAVNCAALPEGLLESELFGIEGGVATGVQARAGKFELADGGTLFLDEIGDMPPDTQVKLLRALQEREIVRVGGQRPIPIDVRLVAATHRDLETLIGQGPPGPGEPRGAVRPASFREDLYYRLKGVEVELPPLRERRSDIPPLVRHFVAEFCRREGIDAPPIRADALAVLMAHDYPGNVRELQNLVEGAVSLTDGEVDRDLVLSLLGKGDEAPAGAPAAGAPVPGGAGGAGDGEPAHAAEPSEEAEAGPPEDLDTVERRHIARVLSWTEGNKTAAAEILGIDRRTLVRKGF